MCEAFTVSNGTASFHRQPNLKQSGYINVVASRFPPNLATRNKGPFYTEIKWKIYILKFYL